MADWEDLEEGDADGAYAQPFKYISIVHPNTSYESIYRLVLITHQSRGPVAGAIAGKRGLDVGSSLSPSLRLNQPPSTTPRAFFGYMYSRNLLVQNM